MQQASCLEGGPLLWIWSLYLHVNQKYDDDDDDDDDDGDANSADPVQMPQMRHLIWVYTVCLQEFLCKIPKM